MIPLPPPSYEQTIEAIASCGVPAANIRISYEDELQSDVITVSDLGGTDEERFRCLREAVHPFYILAIEAADQQIAFFSFADREDRRQARAEAIEWLRAQGMLNRVPQHDPAKGIEEFARALEAACSLPTESALEAFNPFILTFRQDFLERGLKTGSHDGFSCLSRMMAASNADEHDIRLAFIGNEAVSEKDL